MPAVLSDKDVQSLNRLIRKSGQASVKLAQLHRVNPRLQSAGGIRRAKITSEPGSGITVAANLYDVAGKEIVLGGSAGITVYLDVPYPEVVEATETSAEIPASIPAELFPRLKIGDDVFVRKIKYNSLDSGAGDSDNPVYVSEFRWVLLDRLIDPNSIRVYNNSGSTLSAFRFVKITGYDTDNYYYTIDSPDSAELGLARLGAGQLAILRSAVLAEQVGFAYVSGVQKVEIQSSSEDIAVDDPVGAHDGSGKAVKGGPYTCVKVSGVYIWVTRDGI